MNVIGAIVAGSAGTGLMTALMHMAPRMGVPRMDILGMRGSIFTSDAGTATRLGAVIHFMMGAVFALVYAVLWNAGVGTANVLWGLIFGAIHGVGAIVAMPMLMTVHPRKHEMESGPMVVAGQLMGHVVYGIVVALVYAAF